MREALFPPNFPTSYIIWLFFGLQAIIRLIVSLVETIIPDVPEFVDIQIKRQEYCKSKIIDVIQEEEDDDEEGGGILVANAKAPILPT